MYIHTQEYKIFFKCFQRDWNSSVGFWGQSSAMRTWSSGLHARSSSWPSLARSLPWPRRFTQTSWHHRPPERWEQTLQDYRVGSYRIWIFCRVDGWERVRNVCQWLHMPACVYVCFCAYVLSSANVCFFFSIRVSRDMNSDSTIMAFCDTTCFKQNDGWVLLSYLCNFPSLVSSCRLTWTQRLGFEPCPASATLARTSSTTRSGVFRLSWRRTRTHGSSSLTCTSR